MRVLNTGALQVKRLLFMNGYIFKDVKCDTIHTLTEFEEVVEISKYNINLRRPMQRHVFYSTPKKYLILKSLPKELIMIEWMKENSIYIDKHSYTLLELWREQNLSKSEILYKNNLLAMFVMWQGFAEYNFVKNGHYIRCTSVLNNIKHN